MLNNSMLTIFKFSFTMRFTNDAPIAVADICRAVSGVRVIFLAECKEIPEERKNYCFELRLYRSSIILLGEGGGKGHVGIGRR